MVILLLCVGSLTLSAPRRQAAEDPTLRRAVEQFFAMQEAEDVEGYLALWSASAERPQVLALKYIFDSGDDKYSDISIIRTQQRGDRLRVHVSATRDRVERPPRPDFPSIKRHMTMLVSLTYVRENGDWKLVHEGPIADDLAIDLVEAGSAADRERLLQESPEVPADALMSALSRRAAPAAVKRAYGQAQAIYEVMVEIARRFDNRRFEGEALQNLANTYYFQRNYQKALQTYQQRLAIERARGDDAAMAAALGGMGTVHYALAEYGVALKNYRSALAIQEVLGDDAGLGTTLISTGNVLYLQGDYPAAIDSYRRARDINKRIFNAAAEAIATDGLGRVFLAQGDLAAALESFSAVLEQRRSGTDRTGIGESLMNVGEVHFRLGNIETARASFEEARGHFDATKDLPNAGRAWQSIALTDLVAARFAAAEEEYGRSIATCGAAQDRECVAAATVGLAFAQTSEEKFADAIASYKNAIESFSALNRREQAARAEIGLSQAYSGADRQTDAIAAAVRARQGAEALGSDDVLWRALVAEARALRRIGQREQALAAARAAIYGVDQLVATAQLQPGEPVPHDTIAAFATLAVLQAEAGDATSAFETSEKLRVHDLRTSLARSEREIVRGMTVEEREEERAVMGEAVSLQAQLNREKTLPRPDATRIETLERRLASASDKRRAQQERLFARLPELRVWRGLFAPISAADLTSALAEDTALLDFVMDDDDLLVIVAWRGEESAEYASQVVHLSRRKLAEHLGQMLQPDMLKDDAAWRRAAEELTKVIPAAGVERLERARHILIVPHEILWRVPFEALPIGDHYLADAAPLVYLPSVSALVRAPSVPASPDPALLAIAAPEIGAAMQARVKQTAPSWALRSSESGEREARAATGYDADSTRATLLVGAAATEAAARAQLPKAGVLHLAAPFRINGASPLFSPMLLARSPESRADSPVAAADDGVLEAREIMNLDLRARVAMVSDGAAMSMRDAADDVATVHWAWRAAGVPSLVMSRWAADDTAPAFVGQFYDRLRGGDAPDEALQRARRAIRAAHPAPFYWADWFVIGGH